MGTADLSRWHSRQIERAVFQHVRVFQHVSTDLQHTRVRIEVLVRHEDV